MGGRGGTCSFFLDVPLPQGFILYLLLPFFLDAQVSCPCRRRENWGDWNNLCFISKEKWILLWADYFESDNFAAGNFTFTPLILIANIFWIACYVAGRALSISHMLAHLILMIIQYGKASMNLPLQFGKLRHRELLSKVELGFEHWQPSSRACAFNHYAK